MTRPTVTVIVSQPMQPDVRVTVECREQTWVANAHELAVRAKKAKAEKKRAAK